jgi:predicted membrane channel-forming protein YqfA (hemolysin III family)
MKEPKRFVVFFVVSTLLGCAGVFTTNVLLVDTSTIPLWKVVLASMPYYAAGAVVYHYLYK